MKKAFMVFLVLVVLVGTAFAGTQPAGDGKVVVKALAYGDNSNQEGQSWKRIVDSFEAANPNIDIQDEMLYDEAYHQKVVARLAAGDIPDLAYMGADARWGAPWKEANQQVDHRPFIDAKFYDLNLIPPMGPNGEIFEVPLGTSNICTVLFFNAELAASLGLEQPKTYADLVAMVPVAQEAGIEVISIDGADGWAWGSCVMSAFIARLSGDAQWISKAVSGQYKFTDKVFVDSLALITRMVNDGVISSKSVLVDYGTNISNYDNEKALICVQGQWAAGGFTPATQDKTIMMAWPELPGEKANMAGSVAAAIQVGYGLTKSGSDDPAVRDAALKFLRYFYSEPETTQRLRDGAIVAPILKGYKVPEDLSSIIKQKVILAQNAPNTDVLDAFLAGPANDALNAGMQQIASGDATPEEVAAQVEGLINR